MPCGRSGRRSSTCGSTGRCPDIDLRDDVLPSLWFQASGSDEPRQRFHLDLWVAPEVVEAQIAAALAAGGVLVSDAEAPSYWVLADSRRQPGVSVHLAGPGS